MPAPFALSLCGYRSAHGKPNTSDASEAFSVELGRALFEAMGVPPSVQKDEASGTAMAVALASDLEGSLQASGSSLVVLPERPLDAFEQFRHVSILGTFTAEPSNREQRAWRGLSRFVRSRITSPPRDVTRLESLLEENEAAVLEEVNRRKQIVEDVGGESLLKLDVTASRTRPSATLPSLEVGLSLKWSLRTDRAQDCRSQGAKMAALRRGRMPHFAAVTMEPRPYMLNILGGGSGEVDCVYHLDLSSLALAIDETCLNRGAKRAKTRDTFRRLVEQRRLRDYDELVGYVQTL